MNEIWKDIVGYEGHYQVSNTGQIKSLARKIWYESKGRVKAHFKLRAEKILAQRVGTTGYLQISLCLESERKLVSLHRVMAEAFVPNPENKPEVNHKDTNKLNNTIQNFEWMTHAENMAHSLENGRHVKGDTHPMAKITETDVRSIRAAVGAKPKDLAAKYGVCTDQIYLILKRKSWAHVV